MTSPYILPAMLKGLAPLGIDWDSIPGADATSQGNLAALLDICYIASDAIDSECDQPLRSTLDIEELVGPGGNRLVLPPAGQGNGEFQTSHWPVTQALGGQWASAQQFPPQWNAITASQLWVSQGMQQFVGGSFLGSSGSDGMNIIEMQPGIIAWGYGRNAYRVQLAYENGWPMAGLLPAATLTGDLLGGEVLINVDTVVGVVIGAPVTCVGYIDPGAVVTGIGSNTITISQPVALNASAVTIQIGYAPGTTSMIVDDVTGMAGTAPTIYDGASTETVSVLAAIADLPILVLPGVTGQVGQGVITLSTPTRRPHTGSDPASALVSACPSNVRLAGYYYAGAEALQRGGTAFTAPALPGSLQSAGNTPSIGDLTAQAQNQLAKFHRIF